MVLHRRSGWSGPPGPRQGSRCALPSAPDPMNAAWHARHKLPRKATAAERLHWHEAHQRACGCRPIPAALKKAREVEGVDAPEIDPRFAPVVKAMLRTAGVTYGGKGFGSTALKLDGKLFAFISSRGRFVAKLPRDRVEALVASKAGKAFEPGPGRVMKEWLEVDGRPSSWLALAQEAHRFAAGGSAKRKRS